MHTDAKDDAPEWYRYRPYPHFDWPTPKEKAKKVVEDAKRVARHDFYPFIKRIDQERRYKVLSEPTRGKKGDVTNKSRRICYASHLDAHVYAYYARLLSEKYEAHIASKDFNKSVVAYRRFDEPKCNIHFARDVFAHIYEKCTPAESLAALAFDVKGFFDNLSHDILKREWGRVLGDERLPEDHYQLFRSLTKFAYVKERRLRQIFPEFYAQSHNQRSGKQICSPYEFREKVRGKGHLIVNPHSYGIPQGTPISALLSNIYMRPFDHAVYEKVNTLGGMYRRYSDDLVTVVPDSARAEVKQFVMEKISDLKLVIQERKTESYLFSHNGQEIGCQKLSGDEQTEAIEDNQLQYLGFVFDGKNIRIRPSSLTRFYRRMNGALKVEANHALKNANDAQDYTIRRSRLYERFSHKGKRNFVQYAYRAADLMKPVTGRDKIRPQVARHWKVLHDRIDQWESWVHVRLVSESWAKSLNDKKRRIARQWAKALNET